MPVLPAQELMDAGRLRSVEAEAWAGLHEIFGNASHHLRRLQEPRQARKMTAGTAAPNEKFE